MNNVSFLNNKLMLVTYINVKFVLQKLAMTGIIFAHFANV